MPFPSLPVFVMAFIALFLATEAGAQPVDVRSCASLTEPTRRLACYDAVYPPADGASSVLFDLESEREKAREDFGLNNLQLRDRQPEQMRDLDPDQIEAVVARVTQRSTGERVVTLENGQAWLLTEATSKGRLVSGDQIVIRKAALGTFMLLTAKRVPLRARRLN